ncbi:hypothetical protein LCM20_06600 [Halobacillus litoralis]|uniref:hypothetical protein n=1 Tax=Halobacillus litoralis TaxID=45668 RepID=UPI001CD2B733|nr:hypothetical protein [Halobacillus litoralis]MCA0970251.1 hypothetical protein [Halobacillus litoralis]
MQRRGWLDRTQWELVCSTKDINEYFRRLGALKNDGIEVRTETSPAGATHGGGSRITCHYQIYVEENSYHQAMEIL